MKGILGAQRAKTFTPSGYGEGDRGGSAGGYGLPHGTAGGGGAASSGGGVGHVPMAYGGVEHFFEGGVRGGGDPETFPGQYKVRKTGFDEHSGGRSGGSPTHGVDGVEGLDVEDSPSGSSGGEGLYETSPMSDMGPGGPQTDRTGRDHKMGLGHREGPDDTEEHEAGETAEEEAYEHRTGREVSGHRCGSKGCGFAARTPHGLARHALAKHGFKGLGHGLVHGSGYMPGHKDAGPLGESSTGEFYGETEGPAEMSKITHEYEGVIAGIKSSETSISSYARGDNGGSHGRMSTFKG